MLFQILLLLQKIQLLGYDQMYMILLEMLILYENEHHHMENLSNLVLHNPSKVMMNQLLLQV